MPTLMLSMSAETKKSTFCSDDLEMGGPVPIGARQASLTYGVALPYMEEVALNEQVRHTQ